MRKYYRINFRAMAGMAMDPFWGAILAAILTQIALEKGLETGLLIESGFLDHVKRDFYDTKVFGKLCRGNGAGFWLQLFVVSFTFAIIGALRAHIHNLLRCALTLLISFLLNMLISDFGHFAMICAGLQDTKHIFAYASFVIPGLSAVMITFFILVKSK